MSFYKVSENSTIFILSGDQTMFKNVVNFQKVMLVLHNNQIIFDTFEERYALSEKEIYKVEFSRIGSTLITKIETRRGNFIGSQSYKFYKSINSRKIFTFLRNKIENPELYDNLLKSKFELIYALFGKWLRRYYG